MLDARLRHLPEKLPRVGGKRFHIAPLTFGIKSVHRERRLPAAARPAEYVHFVAMDLDVDVLQIVLGRSANGD